MTDLTCPWNPSDFLFFSTDPGVPTLLYYSYVPIILATLIFTSYVLYRDRASLLAKVLFLLGLSFAGYTLNALFQWTSNDPFTQMFSWQMNGVFEFSIFALAAYFVYIFLARGRDVSFGTYALIVLLAPLYLALPTEWNISQFYLTEDDCGGVLGNLWWYIYLMEVLLTFTIAIMCVSAYRSNKEDSKFRGQVMLLGVGSFVFLGIFYLANVLGEITKVYQVNLIGPLGLLAFVAVLTYMIVRYQAFNIKMFATQALVFGIAALIGSRLFYDTSTEGFVLTLVTFLAFMISGRYLIRSVRLEIEHREEIERLAQTLDETNGRQETLIHFIGHEVKGFLTKDAGAFAALSEGDLGALPETAKPFVASALQQSRAGADSVANILKASNLKKGTVSYDKKPFDMKELVASAVERAKQMAADKKLELLLSVAEGSYQMVGDGPQINDHVLRNLIENALNYTPAGTVAVSLKNEGGKVIFSVKDSGIGITDEDKKRLFTEGGHGAESQKVNAHSTGYGLYIAKQIVDAHGGSIRAESEGAGKGSTFIAEFPVAAA